MKIECCLCGDTEYVDCRYSQNQYNDYCHACDFKHECHTGLCPDCEEDLLTEPMV
jgi:hypothetical protein